MRDLEIDGILKYRHQLRPTWIAVIFAIITPLGFAVNAQFVMFLTSELNFDTKSIKRWQFSAATVMSTITLAIAAVFWYFNPDSYYFSFNLNLFWWGLGGSVINILGIVSLQIAISTGPAGPISAFVSLSNVFLTVLECFYYKKGLKITEWVGFFVGFIGVLILVLPEIFQKMGQGIVYLFTCKCFLSCYKSGQRKLKYTKKYTAEHKKKKE